MSFVDFIWKQLSLQGQSLDLLLQDNQAVVRFQNQLFTHLWFLVEALPMLSDTAYLDEFCEISNFFWKKGEFERINSIANYQQYYAEQLAREEKCPSDIFPHRLSDYQIFDVSVMHEPQVIEQTLHYFVFQVASGLPYRVMCPFPYPSSSAPFVHYQILPLLNR